VSATQVTAVTPAGSVGAVDVVVNGPKGSVTVGGGFTYLSIIVPSWATLIEAGPDPAVVTNQALRTAIAATGLAWRVRDTGTQMEMMLIPPGTFQMGCVQGTNDSACSPQERPVHQVTLTNAFYIGRYEVTQSQWVAVMDSNPSTFKGSGYPDAGNRPVETVSWIRIQSYLAATGLLLPTEAQWEYACRAGTQSPLYNGSSDGSTIGLLAWYQLNSDNQTHAVGGKASNDFGLYDTIGNVWEWVTDRYGAYGAEPQINPQGPTSGTVRVLRGGSFVDRATESFLRSSGRFDQGTQSDEWSNVGFRAARNP
jgi:formylglycine-generating enzyme required for sulfatase activity